MLVTSDVLTPEELAEIVSADYGTPIRHVFPLMQARWDDCINAGGNPADDPHIHWNTVTRGGPRAYLDLLKADIAANGQREPIVYNARRRMITNGTHRAVALYELNQPALIAVQHGN